MKTWSGYFIGFLMHLFLLNSVLANPNLSNDLDVNNDVNVKEFQTSLVYKVQSGYYISFDASNSFDLDGDSIVYNWSLDEIKSSYKGELNFKNTNLPILEFIIPDDFSEDTLVLNLSIQDLSETKLETVKQVVLLAKKEFKILSEPNNTANVLEKFSYTFQVSFDSGDSLSLESYQLPDWLYISEMNLNAGYIIVEGIPNEDDVMEANNVEFNVSNGIEELEQSFTISFNKQYKILSVINGVGTGVYAAGDTIWVMADSIGVSFEEWVGDLQYINDPYSSVSYVIMPEHDVALEAIYSGGTKSGDVSNSSTLVTFPVNSSEDDAEEYTNGYVNVDDGNLELVTNNFKNISNSSVGIIFRDIIIPEGKEIKGAFIRFTVDKLTENTNKFVINGVLEGNCRPFMEWNKDVTTRERTENYVNWAPFSWSQENKYEYTTDLSVVVKEVMAQESWESGNAVGFIFSGDGYQIAKSYDGASNEEERPTLIIKLADIESHTSTSIRHLNENVLQLYPNPAKDLLNFKLDSDEVVDIQIVDMSGRILFRNYNNEETINVSTLMRGNYILRVKTIKGIVYTKKFVKIN